MKVWVVALARMEELYVREWINWNRSIGIDHIVIGDNNDSDYEHPLQPVIQDFIDEGYVEVVDFRNQIDVQLKLNTYIWNRRNDQFDWCAFLDIDEFVYCPMHDNKIKEILEETEKRGYNALVFPWLNITSNKQIYYEDKPVQERFTVASNETIVSTKFFLKYSPDILDICSRHCPRQVHLKNGYEIKDISTTFKEESMEYYKSKDGDKRYRKMKRTQEHLITGYIKHFVVKSAEEFVTYRMMRGQSAVKEINDLFKRHSIMYFKMHQNGDHKFFKRALKYFQSRKDEIELVKEKRLKKITH